MQAFNVIIFNFNSKKFESYNVMPYLVDCYNKAEKKPKTYDEFKQFIKKEAQYEFWGRCEYEIVLTDWPNQVVEDKWDVYDQIEMNIDLVTEQLILSVYDFSPLFSSISKCVS